MTSMVPDLAAPRWPQRRHRSRQLPLAMWPTMRDGAARAAGAPAAPALCQDRRMTAEQADLSRVVIGVLGGTGAARRGLATPLPRGRPRGPTRPPPPGPPPRAVRP